MSRFPRSARPGGAPRWLLLSIAAVLFAVGIYLGIEIGKPPPRPDFGRKADAPPPSAGKSTTPPSSVSEPASSGPEPASHEAPEPGEPLPVVRQPAPGSAAHPRLALVIDDLGRSLEDLDTLAALGVPITYAVLPFEVRTAEVVSELRRRGAEYLCHLPMEAQGGANPGPGALLLSMDHAELEAATRKALAAVPGALGVNNHMGSGIAADRGAITTVVSVVAEAGLYFLDSRTTHETLGYTVAHQLGIPAAERQVFLDTRREREYIRGQFAQFLEAARTRGGAIAIAHPYPETLEVLAESVPLAVAEGFEFVRVSALLEQP
jgi:hypothetical protein